MLSFFLILTSVTVCLSHSLPDAGKPGACLQAGFFRLASLEWLKLQKTPAKVNNYFPDTMLHQYLAAAQMPAARERRSAHLAPARGLYAEQP